MLTSKEKGDIMADHYQSKHTSSTAPAEKSRLPLIILAAVLIVCIIGAGVYALLHFVVFAPQDTTAPAADVDATDPTLPSAPPEPTLEPIPSDVDSTPTAADYTAAAEELLRSMSTHDKICQLLIVSPETLTGVDSVDAAGETTRQSLEKYPVGGIIYNSSNLESVEQTLDLLGMSQDYAALPMFMAVDEEGGNVARVAEKLGTTEFNPMYAYKDEGVQVAQSNARTIAADISELGFNLDFAPVADVRTNPDNYVIGSRAYSDDYQQAAELVAAAVKGFSQGGVLCTLKHFPGHGGTTEDTHEGLAYVSADVDALKAGELLPFKSGIAAGADMVMVGHLVVEAVDSELPATLSPKVVPELLRKYLNFNGVVITDGMTMDAITDNYNYNEIVRGIFNADIDMILQPDDIEKYVSAIEDALNSGAITEKQLNKKVMRILTLKLKKGIIPLN